MSAVCDFVATADLHPRRESQAQVLFSYASRMSLLIGDLCGQLSLSAKTKFAAQTYLRRYLHRINYRSIEDSVVSDPLDELSNILCAACILLASKVWEEHRHVSQILACFPAHTFTRDDVCDLEFEMLVLFGFVVNVDFPQDFICVEDEQVNQRARKLAESCVVDSDVICKYPVKDIARACIRKAEMELGRAVNHSSGHKEETRDEEEDVLNGILADLAD
jgi:hypothetical protein